jgi:hypothetical protein
MSNKPAIPVRSQPEHNFDRKQAGMYYLNNMRVLLQERALFVPLARQGNTLSSKDVARAKPHQSGIHPDQQHTSGKTVSDLFEPIKTWDTIRNEKSGS